MADPCRRPAPGAGGGAAGPLAAWRARVAAGSLNADPMQEDVARALEDLHRRLAGHAPAPPVPSDWLARLGLRRRAPERRPPRGLYIHGPVGRGKSMLMDLFFAGAPVAARRRTHFHAFMAEVHDRAHRLRAEPGDPIPRIAAEIARTVALLCFDEFQVDNIADAMILGRLFEALFAHGVAVVSTSNTAPDDLYRNGLQRERFLPFIAVLEARMDVIELAGSEDHRLARLRGRPVYHTPLGPEADRELDRAFRDLTDRECGESASIEVRGRTIGVPEAARGVARFHFDDLCRRPLGAGDYIAIAGRYHTLLLSGLPALAPHERNEARRLVNLVDALYEARCNLVVSAAAPPQGIYPEGDGTQMFGRTISRLMEMQAEDYIARRHMAD